MVTWTFILSFWDESKSESEGIKCLSIKNWFFIWRVGNLSWKDPFAFQTSATTTTTTATINSLHFTPLTEYNTNLSRLHFERKKLDFITFYVKKKTFLHHNTTILISPLIKSYKSKCLTGKKISHILSFNWYEIR